MTSLQCIEIKQMTISEMTFHGINSIPQHLTTNVECQFTLSVLLNIIVMANPALTDL